MNLRIVLVLVATTVIVLLQSARAGQAAPAKPLNIVIAIAEDEYHAKETLPAFAKSELNDPLRFNVKIIQSDSKTDLPGTEALKDADLLIMFLRRRELPEAQLKAFQTYFDSGKPLVAIRTSCHAFQNWLEFDKVVLGCNYNNHYAATGTLSIATAKGQASNPILRGIPEQFTSSSSLYKMMPLADTCTPLLIGTWTNKPAEPVAWTNVHKGGRVFFTSLGSPEDFKSPVFVRLLRNGVLWAAERTAEN
ncbi:MAG TPA: ThuA domain-containing protein [Humisphaera sp.]|nr:ThuA domain-containing protein [Humisphaera sp.]